MVSQTAIVVTALMQMWGKSFFVDQALEECSPAPALGCTIFLAAMLLLIWECNILPKLYRQHAPWIFTVIEILVTVFVMELIMQLGWCTYERIAHRMVIVVCYHKLWCEFAVMAIITIVGAVSSFCVVIEVVCPARIKNSVGEVLDILPVPEGAASFINFFKDIHSYIMGAIYFCQLSREQRLLAVRAFELQLRKSTITKDKSSKEEEEQNKQENPLQVSEELQEMLNLEQEQKQENLFQESTELQESMKKNIQELNDLQDLQDLLDLQTNE